MTWLLLVVGLVVGSPALSQDEARLVEVIRDPVKFTRGFLQGDPWPKQEEILRAIAKPNASVAVKACHASGKTHIAAAVACWFVTRYPDGIVITTAPTWSQVELLLWGEIHGHLGRARIAYPDPNTTALFLSRTNYVVGLSTNEGVRFQGFHAPHLLFIIDEAPGVRPAIFEAIDGARSGGDARVLALGNPVIASGPFYDAFDKDMAMWTRITISAVDTPNFAGITLDELLAMDEDDPRVFVSPRPYLTTRAWVRKIAWQKWGRHGHPNWDARVLGLFPPQAPDALLSLTWVERAHVTLALDDGTPVHVGIDVAGPGEDETAMFVRQGPRILFEQEWASADPRGAVIAALSEKRGDHPPYRERLEAINVDSAGLGYGFALHLRDLFGGVVKFINVGESPSDGERFKNLKAEHYWGLRERFCAGDVVGQMSDECRTQLTGIRWSQNARGQTEIETKEEARKRGVDSPDRAEALMLAFAKPPVSGFMDWIKEQQAAKAAAAEGAT